MTPLRLGRRLHHDDRGTLTVAMLLSLVGVALATLLLPMVLGQVKATQQTSGRVRSLHAAQAGLDTALANIRAAKDSDGAGSLAALPCGPLSGIVGPGGTARYEVTIDYLTSDPKGRSDSWVQDNRLPCEAGIGPLSLPSHALLRARATNAPTGEIGTVPGRLLRATYSFQTTNESIPGGPIAVDTNAVRGRWCVDAGSGRPNVGAAIRLQQCIPDEPAQTWAYEKNLTLRLVSSKTSARPLGLCVQAGTTHALGTPAVLQPCQATTQPYQQWAYNDHAKYAGVTGAALDDFCLGVPGGSTLGSVVALVTCTFDDTSLGSFKFRPVFSVGAGAAGESTKQLVNFEQFGRCLDVTREMVTEPYMIVWSCKQAPNPADVRWNQRWTLPSTTTRGRITVTTDNGALYCLMSPAGSGPGAYPVLRVCPATLPSNMLWKVTRASDDYASAYRIEDNNGDCIAADPDDFDDSADSDISKLIAEPCSSSTLQKWNAPPSLLTPALKDISEE